MTIYNLGSINVDHVYRLAHMPQPGETMASRDYTQGLGGKGANQSVAVARAGVRVVHIGAISAQGEDWVLDRLSQELDSLRGELAVLRAQTTPPESVLTSAETEQ